MEEGAKNNVDSVILKLGRVKKECVRDSKSIKYVVRTARKADAEALASMYKEAFPQYPYKELHDSSYHAELPDYILRVVAELDKKLVGAAALEVDAACLLAEVEHVATRPEWRSKGIARTLVKECVKIGEEVGLEKLYAYVRTREPAAMALFYHEGFEPICIMKGHFIVYHDPPVRENMLYMEKFLNDGEKLIDKENRVDPELTKHIFKNALHTHYMLRLNDSERLL
jgi:N-acetylglutamate synthase-like GNAT family acetyltransferase